MEFARMARVYRGCPITEEEILAIAGTVERQDAPSEGWRFAVADFSVGDVALIWAFGALRVGVVVGTLIFGHECTVAYVVKEDITDGAEADVKIKTVPAVHLQQFRRGMPAHLYLRLRPAAK